MATYATIITDIRDSLDDDNSGRWTDAKLMRLLAKSTERAGHILYNNGIQFGRKVYTITTANGDYAYDLPSDFMAHSGLYRADTYWELTYRADSEWELIVTASELSNWRIIYDSGAAKEQIEVKGTPTAARTLRLYYWPLIDARSLTTASSTPAQWGGRLDRILEEYVTNRCKNIDMEDIAQDAALSDELERLILNTYGSLDAGITQVRGYLEYV